MKLPHNSRRLATRVAGAAVFTSNCPVWLVRYVHRNPDGLQFPAGVRLRVEHILDESPPVNVVADAVREEESEKGEESENPQPGSVVASAGVGEPPPAREETATPVEVGLGGVPTPVGKAVKSVGVLRSMLSANLDSDRWRFTSMSVEGETVSSRTLTVVYEACDASGVPYAWIRQTLVEKTGEETFVWDAFPFNVFPAQVASTLVEAQVLAYSSAMTHLARE